MDETAWHMVRGDGPIVAAAIHNGHDVRPEVSRLLALDDQTRLREEDPFTESWTSIAPTQIVGLRSRFEIDLNRPRNRAVYLTPEDAWGLQVWRHPPSREIVDRSRALFDAFYRTMRHTLRDLTKHHGRVVVLDLHSYNYRRAGPDAPSADPALNPEVNVGTGTMDRRRWARLVDRFLEDLRNFDFLGRRLDVRENIKFFGGNFPAWIHKTFPETVCVLSLEIKKFFMDEWSGEPYYDQIAVIGKALEGTVPGVLEALREF